MRNRAAMKGKIFLVVVLLLAVFVVGLAWKFVEADKCFDAGGIVVGAFMQGQRCVMKKHASS